MKKFKFIFQRLFPSKTPLILISDHVNCIFQVCLILNDLIKDYFLDNEITRYVDQISYFERKADNLKNELRQLIRKSYKISFAREDILEFIHIQDNIMDSFEDFGKMLFLNKISFEVDEQVLKILNNLADEVISSVKNYKDLIDNFISGFSYGFAKPVIDLENKIMEELETIEHRIDTISIDLGKMAFSKKNEYNPIDIIHFNNLVITLSKIPNSISRLTDKILDFIHY